MQLILAKNLVGDLSFTIQNNGDAGAVAELVCTVDPQLASESDEDKATLKRVQTILSNGNGGGDGGKLSLFGVRMVLLDPSQVTQRLEGSIHGALFRTMSQAFNEEPMIMKLDIGLVCSARWRKKIVSQNLDYLIQEAEPNIAFRFIELLDSCWIPTPGFQYRFELTAELISKPSPVNFPPVNLQMPLSLSMMNRRCLEEGIQADFALVTGSGASIRCHKIFLQAASQAFARMIEVDRAKDPPQNSITLPDSSTKEGVGALLKYLYFRDLEDPNERPEIACELLVISHCYQIPDLGAEMKELLLEMPDEWWQRDRNGDVADHLLAQTRRWGDQYEDLLGRVLEVLKWRHSKTKDEEIS